MNIMNIGRGQIKGLDHTDRINFQVKPKAIKGLITEFLAVAGKTFEKFAISGSGKSAYRHWKAVKNQNCISETGGNVFEQTPLGSPQVSSVANKADPGRQFWEVMAVKSFEEFEDFFVGLKAKTFTDYFHCKYFAVSQLRQWASLSKCPSMKPSLSSLQICLIGSTFYPSFHEGLSPFSRGLIQLMRRCPFSVASSKPRSQTELSSFQPTQTSNFSYVKNSSSSNIKSSEEG
jgi:hypothetical protein